jgi:acyl carrier protein
MEKVDMDQIIERINMYLAEEFEVDLADIKPELPLKETLDLDSLDYVDLVVIIEGNFGFKVKQEDFTSIVTFQDLYNYVSQKTTETANS